MAKQRSEKMREKNSFVVLFIFYRFQGALVNDVDRF
jgi:hypothetical protein